MFQEPIKIIEDKDEWKKYFRTLNKAEWKKIIDNTYGKKQIVQLLIYIMFFKHNINIFK